MAASFPFTPMPDRGLPRYQVMQELLTMKRDDQDWRGGRVFGLVYSAGDEVHELLSDALSLYSAENGLNVLAFPSIGVMEHDLVSNTGRLLGADEPAAGGEVEGYVTSGGTESLLQAVKTARDVGRERGIARPQVVAGQSAHAAFTKAADYFDVDLIRVPVEPDFTTSAAALEAACSADTIMVVGSARDPMARRKLEGDMRVIRVGIVAAAALGSTAFFGTQVASAAKPASDLAVYEAVGAPVTSMSLEFTVPHYTCTAANEFASAYADTFDSANGGEFAFDAGYVEIGCSSTKQAEIYPLLEIDGTYSQPTLKIKKGNVMQVSITCITSGSVATLTDETTDNSVTDSSSNSADWESAYLGNIGVANEKGTKVLALPSFGAFDFSAANVNGGALGALNPTAVDYKEGADAIKVGALTDGTSWVNTEKS